MASFQQDVFKRHLKTQLLGRSVILRAEVGSTQDEAHQAFEDRAAHGTVVIAEAQLAGRGRMQRVWESRAYRGLYLSLLLRVLPSPTALHLLSLAVGLGTARGIGKVLSSQPSKPMIKWPNDILLGSAKCAGILIETKVRQNASDTRRIPDTGRTPGHAVVGVGVNVYGDTWNIPREGNAPPREATTLEAVLRSGMQAKELSVSLENLREEVAASILNEMEGILDRAIYRDNTIPEREEFLQSVQRRLAWRGERVSCGALHGILHGIDANGSLILIDGETKHSVHAGELDKDSPLHRT